MFIIENPIRIFFGLELFFALKKLKIWSQKSLEVAERA